MMRKVARAAASLCSAVLLELRCSNEPNPRYSCAKMIASSLWSSPVKNFVQNARMDSGEERSAYSAKICSFFVVVRSTGMSNDGMECSVSGCSDRAMTCAPLAARDDIKVSPSGVKPPYCNRSDYAERLCKGNAR